MKKRIFYLSFIGLIAIVLCCILCKNEKETYTEYNFIYKFGYSEKYAKLFVEKKGSIVKMVCYYGNITNTNISEEFPDTSAQDVFFYRIHINKIESVDIDTLKQIFLLDEIVPVMLPFCDELSKEHVDYSNFFFYYRDVNDTIINNNHFGQNRIYVFPCYVEEQGQCIDFVFIYNLENGILLNWGQYNSATNKSFPIRQLISTKHVSKDFFNEVYSKGEMTEYKYFMTD